MFDEWVWMFRRLLKQHLEVIIHHPPFSAMKIRSSSPCWINRKTGISVKSNPINLATTENGKIKKHSSNKHICKPGFSVLITLWWFCFFFFFLILQFIQVKPTILTCIWWDDFPGSVVPSHWSSGKQRAASYGAEPCKQTSWRAVNSSTKLSKTRAQKHKLTIQLFHYQLLNHAISARMIYRDGHTGLCTHGTCPVFCVSYQRSSCH